MLHVIILMKSLKGQYLDGVLDNVGNINFLHFSNSNKNKNLHIFCTNQVSGRALQKWELK
jgi:hypothetical protein